MEVVNALLNEGMEQGYITYDQILKALPNVENNLALLETILEEAQSMGITIFENEEEASNAIGAEEDISLVDDELDVEALFEDDSPSSHTAPLFDLSNVPIDDSVGLYFREMGQQSLLTADEEVQLAKEIEAGRAAAETLDTAENLTDDDIDELINIRETGDAARAHLIRANTRLVVSIAKKYRGRGLQFLDLIQEGNFCLMKAV